jgi:hypothetical protein
MEKLIIKLFKVRGHGILIQSLCFWPLSILLLLFKTHNVSKVDSIKTSSNRHIIQSILMHLLTVDRAYYYIIHIHVSDRLLYIHPFRLYISFLFGIREYRVSSFTYTALSTVVCLEITAFSDMTLCSLVDHHQCFGQPATSTVW